MTLEWYQSAARTIRTIYLEELNREPEFEGWAAWLWQARENGMNAAGIRAAVRTSPEWHQIHDVPPVPPFPPPPTRHQVCGVNLTFQGLTVHTQQFGTLPWFEAALVSLTEADRRSVYAAKHAAGDTHCIVAFTWSYTEPGQPYINVPGRDFTLDIPAFILIVREVIQAGFVPMVFLGGDDGENGYPVAVNQLKALTAAMGELNAYVLYSPGWDGVFYGWTPQHIADFGVLFRQLVPNGYLALEHQPGRIPIGGGPIDFGPNGAMRNYDVLLSEFASFPERGDQIWQVAGRLLGPQYRRPADQPASDDPSPPYYLSVGTPRGPYYAVAFEFNEFNFVRDGNVPNCQSARTYLRSLGYAYTG